MVKKKQDIDLRIQWVKGDRPLQANDPLVEFIARALRPEIFEAVEESRAALLEAERLLREPYVPSVVQGSDDDVDAKITMLEAEIAELKAQKRNK